MVNNSNQIIGETSDGSQPYINNNPRATYDEIRIGEFLGRKALSGELPGVARVEGSAEVLNKRSGDYRFILADGSQTSADLMQPETSNTRSIAINIINKSEQAEIVVVELGRGENATIVLERAITMAEAVIATPGHEVERVIVVKESKIIVDRSR